MREIRVKFVDFWREFNPRDNFLYRALSKHYNVVFEDKNPDYIFCSVFAPPFTSCTYDGIRILYSGENFVPDFNWADYGISSYPINYYDRAYYCPVFVNQERFFTLEGKSRDYPEDFLKNKTMFANFISSHDSEGNVRGDFFKKLSEYKRVESPGSYLNNMDQPIKLSHEDESKVNFQRKTKFTLCFESTVHPGFVTEKLSDAFYADTIPVYYGPNDAKEIFNPEAFINVADYDSFDRVIRRIKELDNDDEKYMAMLRQPIFNDPAYPSKLLQGLEDFLCHIIDQPKEAAYRRSRVYAGQRYSNFIRQIKWELPPLKIGKKGFFLNIAVRLKRAFEILIGR